MKHKMMWMMVVILRDTIISYGKYVSRLDVALQQVSAAKRKQKWRKIIDSIML